MKTITIDYDLYQKEIIQFREKGKRDFILRLSKIMDAIKLKDFREALCILEEEFEDDQSLLDRTIQIFGLSDFAIEEYRKIYSKNLEPEHERIKK